MHIGHLVNLTLTGSTGIQEGPCCRITLITLLRHLGHQVGCSGEG
jgi:hypothetical protein